MRQGGTSSVGKVLGWLIALALLAAGATAAWLWVAVTRPYQGFAREGVFVSVPHGASRRAVARLLEREGVVRSAIAFEIYARRHPKRTPVAGEYFFAHAASGRDVFWQLANGRVYVQPFVVREGETMFDIARKLEAAKFMTADEFLAATNDPGPVHDLAPGAQTLEGFLFPATYELPRHPTANEVAAKMVQKFREEWEIILATPAAPAPADPPPAVHPNAGHVVTLASLVERETPQPEERPLVAGVYENRLRKRMLLQCDPTVIYALEQAGSYKGSLTGKNLQFDSPYNTYRKAGLPPGPIGNPGEASLRAALHPAETDALYFVANTQGGHFFSKTLAQHNWNVLRYHRLLRGLPDLPPEEPKPAPAPQQNKRHPSHKGKKR